MSLKPCVCPVHPEGMRRNRSAGDFMKKYFAAGQKTTQDFDEMMKLSPPSPFSQFITRHRAILGILIPPVILLLVWFPVFTEYELWNLYPIRYDMALVMCLGSFIGGATAEGSGAIAFPVMTLLLHTPSTVARDFSAMIQSVGMTSAAATVQIMGILIEKHTFLFATLGGFLGTGLSLEYLEPNLSGEVKKMVFVSVFFSFAMALYLLNREKKRVTYDQIQHFDAKKAVVLLCTGFVGGIFAGIGGSGIDIFSFSVITLLYRVNEKVATPTTVSLAGVNSLFTFYWTYFKIHSIETLSWEYFAVCFPVTSIMSPLGSVTSSYFHRLTLAFFIYILETAALVGAVLIIQPEWKLLTFCGVLILTCFAFYISLERIGRKLIEINVAISARMSRATSHNTIASAENGTNPKKLDEDEQEPQIIWIGSQAQQPNSINPPSEK